MTAATARSLWRAAVESYPCPQCGAGEDDACLTSGGKRRAPHAARARQELRCPGCGIRLAADCLPGDWCDLCTVRRQLIAERYRHPTRPEGRRR